MLERERGVVQNEKRQGENQPYGRVFQRMVETIYPAAHPYSWSTIGSMADLDAATLDDVKEWYRTYYGPNNCVLSLAGDITPERALELVKKYFDGIPPGPPLRRASAWVPRFERNIRDEMEDRVPQTRIYRVYHAPGWRDTDLQHLNLAAGVLSGSQSARLDRRLVYDKELATDVSVVPVRERARRARSSSSMTAQDRASIRRRPSARSTRCSATFLATGPTAGGTAARAQPRGSPTSSAASSGWAASAAVPTCWPRA